MTRRCGACRAELPADAHNLRTYCSTRCKRAAARRRALQRGQISDPATIAAVRAEMEAALAMVQRERPDTE